MDEHVEAALMIAGAQMKAKDDEIARLRAELAAERERISLKLSGLKSAAWIEKQRIVRVLLDQADAAHDVRNYHDRDRYRDAAWLVERA